MAGHSKWANIQHKKARADAQRGKIFTRLIKEITVAARLGGGDPGANPRLRLAMDKAAASNMPKDNVQRAIDKGTGNLEGVEYIELRYEGYGIGGAALMVDCLTDNKTRTVADVRHAFSKHGGNLGTDGCVAFNFKHQGYLLFGPDTEEEALMDEVEGHTAVGAQIAAVFIEGVAHVGDGAGFVVGQAVHHQRRAADAVAFVAQFDIFHPFQVARTFVDGALHVVFGHIVFGGFFQSQAQARVGAGVAAAHAGRNGDFFN